MKIEELMDWEKFKIGKVSDVIERQKVEKKKIDYF